MLTNRIISKILHESALALNQQINGEDLQQLEFNNRDYRKDEFEEFKRDLMEAGNQAGLLFLQYELSNQEFRDHLSANDDLLLVLQQSDNEYLPILVDGKSSKKNAYRIMENENEPLSLNDLNFSQTTPITFFVVMASRSLVSDHNYEDGDGSETSPFKRFIKLLAAERKEIYYIIFYALIVGLIGLILPLGIQTTVELISGGVFFSSVYVLIGIVIVGVIIGGALQIVQLTLVEYLQQRIFTKASLEFAFRIPRIRLEALHGKYAPELINRFFDIITIQKGLPKLLMDFSAGIVQIFFGLLLLSLYHPLFIFFSVILILLVAIMFYFTGSKGLSSSIQESKYKYKIVHWLEEVARTLNSFKIAGTTDLPIRKTDSHVANYLKYRKTHFNVLVTQFSFAVFFKAAITGGLLIMGTILVVNREITLGQFVAAEVVIILVITAVEKIVLNMDVVYDLLTAVDKVAHVTDLPLEKAGGFDLQNRVDSDGYHIHVNNLTYRYPENPEHRLKNINLKIEAGEHVCISGPGGSGKSTLTNILVGLNSNFTGSVAIDGYSIRDLDLAHMRNKVAKNISPEELFDGTLIENITVGKSMESISDVMDALREVKLDEEVNQFPEGLNTHVVSGGKGLSNTTIHKLILARCFAKKPRLLILNDFFTGLKRTSKLELINSVINKAKRWTLITVSNDPLVMASCDRVLVMNNGSIEAEGTFEELMRTGVLTNYIE